MPIDGRLRDRPASMLGALLALVAVVGTVPPGLVAGDARAVSPAGLAVPPLIALVLGGVGLTALGAWRLVAVGARVALVVGLLGAAVVVGEGIAIGNELGTAPLGPLGGAAGGAVAGAGLLGVLVRWRCRWGGDAPAPAPGRGPVIGACAVLAALVVTRSSVPAWLAVVGVVGILLVGLPLLVARLGAGMSFAAGAPRDRGAEPASEDGALAQADPYATIAVEPPVAPRPVRPGPALRILHLGLADPGEAAGTPAAELVRRLAAEGHEILVVSPWSRGARDRVEHHGAGRVHWNHPGPGRGWTRAGRLLGHAVAAIVAVRHVEADLVVEELIAPLGSLAVPRWTRRPVVAVAAWLPAPVPADRWAPLHRLRWWAIRSHRSVIARSPSGAAALAAAGSRADVALVGTGIDPAALRTTPRPRGQDVVVHVGRGTPGRLGPLLDAWARAAPRLPGRLVLLGADRDDAELRGWVTRSGLAERVELATPHGEARHARVASAWLAVVAPGASPDAARTDALEALAVGTPVLGPATAALREVVPPAVGVLVPEDGPAERHVEALSDALLGLSADPRRGAAAAAQGPGLARVHDRDVLAGQTEDVYLAAAGRVRSAQVSR